MLKILIIEDDHIISHMYQTLLVNHGYEVYACADGAEGLNAAVQIHPDLILLDIQLPTLDGMKILHTLRQDPWGKTARVIVLTNFDTSDKILSGIMKDEPAYYLVKSNTPPDEVLEKVAEVLRPALKH